MNLEDVAVGAIYAWAVFSLVVSVWLASALYRKRFWDKRR